MKLKKLILGTAFLSLTVFANADIRVNGYVDYTSTVAAQQIQKKNSSSDWKSGEVMSEFGEMQNGIQFLNLNANMPNVDFHAAVWIGSGLGPWYGSEGNMMYPDRTKETVEPGIWDEMFVITHFIDDQLRLYSGVFAGNGWNANYLSYGYVSAQNHISPLAMRGSTRSADSAFTGIEVLPRGVSGLKFITGLPIAPFNSSYEKFNNWEHLCKAVKLIAQYKWLLYNVTFNAGIRPNTYGTSAKRADTVNDYTSSLYGEGFLQADMPSLFYGVLLNANYDLRWRKVSEKGKNLVNGKDWSTTAFAHIAMASAKFTLIPEWTICAEEAAAFYDSHYLKKNERAFYNRLGLSAVHPLPGTPYEFGLQGFFMYGQDAKGTMVGRDDSYCSDLIGFQWNYMTQGDEVKPKSGTNGRYFAGYIFPYIQKNFGNGNAKLGVEFNYSHLKAASTVQTFVWRVPVGLVFWW